MLTSVTCRRRQPAGYTLLELLIVMSLVSVVTAVTFPGLQRLYESVNNQVELEELTIEINGLGRKSYESSSAFVLTPKSDLNLPDGWRLEIAKPIRYSQTGFCSGGTISLINDDELQLRQRLTPPYCQIRDES